MSGAIEWLSSKRAAPYLFLAPIILFALTLFIGPLLFALWISLTNWDGLSPPRFVGLGNYLYLAARDPFFAQSILNTFVFALGSVAIGVPAALVTAAVIARSRFQAFWRTVYWLPMATNIVAIAYIWKFLLNDTNGLVNRALDVVGLAQPNWLTNPSISMFSVVLVASWMSLGHNILLFLAGLNNVDRSYYEAGELDGAGAVALFRHVTIPMLMPTILFVLVTSFITALSSFALMLILTEGGPIRSTTVTGLYLYEMAFTDLRLGRASAAAYVLSALILAVSLVQLRLFRRGGVEAH